MAKALLVVDPDQLIVPECQHLSHAPTLLRKQSERHVCALEVGTSRFPPFLEHGLVQRYCLKDGHPAPCWPVFAGGFYGSPDVATRDFGRPQTLNNGVRGCPGALCKQHHAQTVEGRDDSLIKARAFLFGPSFGEGCFAVSEDRQHGRKP